MPGQKLTDPVKRDVYSYTNKALWIRKDVVYYYIPRVLAVLCFLLILSTMEYLFLIPENYDGSGQSLKLVLLVGCICALSIGGFMFGYIRKNAIITFLMDVVGVTSIVTIFLCLYDLFYYTFYSDVDSLLFIITLISFVSYFVVFLILTLIYLCLKQYQGYRKCWKITHHERIKGIPSNVPLGPQSTHNKYI